MRQVFACPLHPLRSPQREAALSSMRGQSEEVVARALDGRSGRPYVFTKCERNWNANREIVKSLKRDSVRKECEDSLRRLRVDAIDLYQIHWPEPDEDIEEGWETLARLKQEGKVRWDN